MKNIIQLLTFTFFLHLSASAAVPLSWTVETSRATPAQFEAYQGETLALEASLQSYGKPLETSGIAALYWQTNGMGSAYWQTTAAVNSNRLSAVFTPEMDVGAKVYNCFIGQPGTIYHAAFQLRLRPSPGATPNVLPLPTPVIDFAKVTVLNPPWGSGGGTDTNDVIAIANATIATNPVVAAKLDGPTVAPTNVAENAGKAADAMLTGIALMNRYTKAETDAKLAGKLDKVTITYGGSEVEGAEYAQDADHANNADSANDATSSQYASEAVFSTYAENDGNGNNIESTYAKKPSDATSGNLASLTEDGDLEDSGISKDDVVVKDSLVSDLEDAASGQMIDLNVVRAGAADIADNAICDTEGRNIANSITQLGDYVSDAQETADEAKDMISPTDPIFSNAVKKVMEIRDETQNLKYTITADDNRFYFEPIGAINPED